MKDNSKILRILNNQRIMCQNCDVVLKLDHQPDEVYGHFCVLAGQSQFIESIGSFQKESLQFSIKNPLIITIRNFDCFTCVQTIMELLYENVIVIDTEHETHMNKLAQILDVSDDIFEPLGIGTTLKKMCRSGNPDLLDVLDTQHLFKSAQMNSTPYLCPHCGKGFRWKQGLSSHLLIHSKEKQMLCDVCGYSTTHMKALKSHKLQHTGEFFKCTYPGCTHRSNRKENLKLHIETHNKERPFVCEVCGCKFSQSKNLKRHALKHSLSTDGIKKYKCQLCSFSSYRSDNLREHVQRLHTEKDLQLELPETVENSFESKINDEFNLPEICLMPDLCAKQSCCDAKLNVKPTIRKLTTTSVEKEAKMHTAVNYMFKQTQRVIAPKPRGKT